MISFKEEPSEEDDEDGEDFEDSGNGFNHVGMEETEDLGGDFDGDEI